MEHIKSITKSPPKMRNVSLPHLKKTNSNYNKKKKKVPQHHKHKNNNGWKKDETW